MKRQESYDFRFQAGESTDKILALKQVDFQNQYFPGILKINTRGVRWDHSLLGVLIEVLFHFKERNLSWKLLCLNIDSSSHSLVRTFLHRASAWFHEAVDFFHSIPRCAEKPVLQGNGCRFPSYSPCP